MRAELIHLQLVKELHEAGAIGGFDAAAITKTSVRPPQTTQEAHAASLGRWGPGVPLALTFGGRLGGCACLAADPPRVTRPGP